MLYSGPVIPLFDFILIIYGVINEFTGNSKSQELTEIMANQKFMMDTDGNC